jgi:hypothetical protein
MDAAFRSIEAMSFDHKRELAQVCAAPPSGGLPAAFPDRARQGPKVFWFFFSKKNRFLHWKEPLPSLGRIFGFRRYITHAPNQ